MRSKGFHLSLALIASVGLITLTGCGGGDGDSARFSQTVDASQNTISSLKLVANPGYVHFKSFYQFELKGIDAKNQENNLTAKATWKIVDPSVNNLGKIENGYFKANGVAGTFTLVAEYAGLPSVSQKVEIFDANLTAVTIDNPTASVDECTNLTLTASASFGDRVVPYPLTWKIVEGGGIASFKDPATGKLSTTNNGSVKVVAVGLNNEDKEILSESAQISVNEALTKITLTTKPAKTELRDGDSATVTVMGTYRDPAAPLDITDNATLSTDTSNRLKIEGTKITAQNGTSNGASATLKASCGDAMGELPLTIKERELKSIEIKNSNGGTSNLTLTEGNQLDLDVTATYADNSTKANYTSDNLIWEIDDRNNSISDDSKVTLSSAGVLNVNSELNLTSAIVIYVTAKIKDADGDVLVNSSNTEITDEINITINPN